MKNLKDLSILILVAVISFSAGKYFSSPEIKESEKVSVKERTDITRNVDKKEIIKPDGTRIIETSTSTVRTKDSSSNSEISKEITSRSDWKVNLLYQPMIVSYQNQTIILDVQKRIIGEVYLGVFGTSEKTFGVSLGVGF